MGIRKYALIILALVAPSGAANAQTFTAEQAIAKYRTMTSVVVGRSVRSNNSNDIVVCANRNNEKHRLPLREEINESGERPRLAFGEAAQARSNLDPPCPPRGCHSDVKFLDGVKSLIKALQD